ncbi:MAG: FG-GAP-like repeat-containing protein [Candidatus Margulisbacteria bacterium]|jgi:hypothetical protein|nr:FG-GAP-like repeat-containing protein [Candidatus Margulisiibacteriota bacterium]
MLNKIKTLFGACVFLLGITAFLSAAGSYLETENNLYDIPIMTQEGNPTVDTKLTIGKHVFSGAIKQGSNNPFLNNSGGNHRVYTPAAYNVMSTDSNKNYIIPSGENYIHGSGQGEQRYEMRRPNYSTSEKLLPGFPAMAKNMVAKKDDSIFDVYPGTANIINHTDFKISFKIYATLTVTDNGNLSDFQPGNTNKYAFTTPYMNLASLNVIIQETPPGNSTTSTNVWTFDKIMSGNIILRREKTRVSLGGYTADAEVWTTTPFVIPGLRDNLAYGFDFFREGEMESGTTVYFEVQVPRAGDPNNYSQYSHTYITAGVPFLDNIVSKNTETGMSDDISNEVLHSQLYGWTADGGKDINGDGFPDLIVGDPYYKYTNASNGSKQTGRVYVYFGGPDKILDSIKDLPSPDIIIEDRPTIAVGSRDREFGYKVKLADINNDGFADILVGQPSYATDSLSINQGRILIYYGGKWSRDGKPHMNITDKNMIVSPSIIINSDKDILSTGDPYRDPLFGAVFDVGDINGDGYADIVAKIGNDVDYKNNFIYVISGQEISSGTNADLSRLTKHVDLKNNLQRSSIYAVAESEVAIIGDMNKDGINDFAVSYPRLDEGYSQSYSDVRVFYGRKGVLDHGGSYGYTNPNILLMDKSENNDYFGISLAGGDINRDGCADLIIGKLTTSADKNTGKVVVLLGQEGVNKANYTYNGDDPNQTSGGVFAISDPLQPDPAAKETASQFGLKVAVADVNNDSYDDILIGAPYYGGSEIGAVYLVLGTGIEATQKIQDNHFHKFVITGREAHAHYGMTIANLGDFNQNGYNDILIGAPGFYGDSFFRGYPMASGDKNYMTEHNIDIFSNTKGIDNALPGILLVSANPQDQEIAWNESINTINLVLFDRGKAGLEFSSIQVELYDPATDRIVATLLNSAMERGIPNGQSERGSDYDLKSLWLSSGNYNDIGIGLPRHFDDFYSYYSGGNGYNERIASETIGSQILYRYNQTPRFIGLQFKLIPGKNIFADSKDYQLRVKVADRGGLTDISQFDEYRLSKFVLNMSTNEPTFASVSHNYRSSETSGNPGTDPIVEPGTLIKVRDMNFDGLDDFVVAYPNWSGVSNDSNTNTEWYNGKVTLLYGSAAPDFTGSTNATWFYGAKDGETNTSPFDFGASVASARLNMGQTELVNVLLIGSNTGFYPVIADPLLPNTTRTSQEMLGTFVEFNTMQEGDVNALNANNHLGKMIVLNSGSDATPDLIAVMNKTATHYQLIANSGIGSYTKGNWLPIDGGDIGKSLGGEAGATANAVQMIAARINNTDTYPSLVFGLPHKDKVIIHHILDEVDVSENKKSSGIVISSSAASINFGASLAAGYFDVKLNVSGNPVDNSSDPNKPSVQSLAIGAPKAKRSQADTGGTGYVLVIHGDKLQTMDITAKDGMEKLGTQNVNYYLRYGEQLGSNFGSSLVALKYMASPEHLAGYEGSLNRPYHDDYDDLAVGAPEYKMDGETNGKVYIYRGGEKFPTVASTAYARKDRTNLGTALANVGDVQNVRAEFLAIYSTNNGDPKSLDYLRTNTMLDTEPPVVISMFPENNQYEVTLDQKIRFTVEDISGVNSNQLNITRVIEGRDVAVVRSGVIVGGQQSINGGKNFDLQVWDVTDLDNPSLLVGNAALNVMPKRVRYVVSLNNCNWNPSEVVELKITVGDGRMIFTTNADGTVRQRLSPLVREFNYGFIAKYDANDAIKTKEIFGSRETNTYFGSSIAYVGDVNKDGYPDFVVGEYGNNSYGWMSGKAYLFLGDKDIDNMTEPAAEFTLQVGSNSSRFDANSAKFGWRVAPAGDINGDGYDDVAVMAVNSSTSGGEVFVLFGNPDPRIVGKGGLKTERDRIYQVAPAPKSFPWDSDYISYHAVSIRAAANASGPDGLGYGLYGGGDLNGDGYDDLLIGAPYHDEKDIKAAGRVYVLYGGNGLLDIHARKSYKYSSVASSYAGPLMLDNVIYDATQPNSGANSFVPQAFPVGYIPNPDPKSYDMFGWSVLTGINLNGDSFDRVKTFNGISETRNIQISDLLIGAPGVEQQKGKVYIYTGKRPVAANQAVYGVDLQNKSVSGGEPGEKFGSSLANLGDISADDNKGYGSKANNLVGQDFVVGAPGYKNMSGAAYLFVSRPEQGNDININKELTVYGQKPGDQFGYTVANVGSIDNDPMGNNDFAVGAPYYDEINRFDEDGEVTSSVSLTPNVGRVYIFGTSLENTGSEENPDYVLKTSVYPSQVATGKQANAFFGAAISSLGDIDQDFSPEYLVGAPGYEIVDTTSTLNTRSNIGRVYFYTNPDTKSPIVFGPMENVYTFPIPGAPNVDLFTKTPVFDSAGHMTNRPKINYNEPLRFRVFDDRAVKLDSVMVELRPEGKNHVSRYTFVPSQTGRKYYTYVNRKNVDFFLNLGADFYYETTYNLRIYATDQKGNALDYNYEPSSNANARYNGYIYDRFGSGTIGGFNVQRVPWAMADLGTGDQDAARTISERSQYVLPYFEYSFITGTNPTGEPEPDQFELWTTWRPTGSAGSQDTNGFYEPTDNILDYFVTRASLYLKLKSASDGEISSYNILAIPAGAVTSAEEGISFNVIRSVVTTNKINYESVGSNDKRRLVFGEKGTAGMEITVTMNEDGIFTLGVWASDVSGNSMPEPRLRTFVHDEYPPKIVTGLFFETQVSGSVTTVTTVNYLPAAGSTHNADDCAINFAIVDKGAGLDVVSTNGAIDLDKFQIYLSFGRDTTTNYNLDTVITVTINVATLNTAGETEYVDISSTMNFWKLITENLTVNARHMDYPDGSNSAKPTTLSIGILEQKFTYLDWVNILVKATDNAGHGDTITYSYRVSPDYRPPQVTYGQPPLINEGEYTWGQLTISLNAYDDVNVAYLVFTVAEDDNAVPSIWNTALLAATNNNGFVLPIPNPIVQSRSITLPVTWSVFVSSSMQTSTDAVTSEIITYNLVEYIRVTESAKDYSGLARLELRPSDTARANPPDGLYHILVAFEDEQHNRSDWTTCSIILDAESETGGPVMPIVRVNYHVDSPTPNNVDVTGLNIPHAQNMPLYFSKDTSVVDLYVYAKDTIVSPQPDAMPSGWLIGDDTADGRPLGVVVSVYSPNGNRDTSGNAITVWRPRGTDGKRASSDILLNYRTQIEARDVNYSGYMMRKIPAFDLSDYVTNNELGEVIDLYVNFADNDMFLPKTFLETGRIDPSDGNSDLWSDYLFTAADAKQTIINARYPTVSYYDDKYDLESSTGIFNYHPFNYLNGLVDAPIWDSKGVTSSVQRKDVISAANAFGRESTLSRNVTANFSEAPAHIRLYYDNTLPELTDLLALGGTAGGQEYSARSYSQNKGYLRFSAKYRDRISTNLMSMPLEVHKLYYQILAVTASGEDTMVWVDTKGDSYFKDRQKKVGSSADGYWRSGSYRSYDDSGLDAGQWIYLTSPTNNKLDRDPGNTTLSTALYKYLKDARNHNKNDLSYVENEENWVTINEGYNSWLTNPESSPNINYDIPSPKQRTNLTPEEEASLEAARYKAILTVKDADGQDITVSANKFATENLTARYMVSANLSLWSVLDISDDKLREGSAYNNWETLSPVEIPVSLDVGVMYFLRVAARDQAGNFSKIAISNPVYIDNTIPNEPSYNYMDGIVLNRNRFDIDFSDNYSGIYNLRLSKGDDTIEPIYLDNQAVTKELLREWRDITTTDRPDDVSSDRTFDYKQQVLNNWKVKPDIWDKLAEGEKTKFYFYLEDAVGLSYSTIGNKGPEFSFVRDTLAPTFDPSWDSSPNGVVSIVDETSKNIHYYTQDETLGLNVKPLEAHLIAVTDLASDWVVATSNTDPRDPRRIDPTLGYFEDEYHAYDDLRHIQDFSFEWEGDHEIRKPWYVQLSKAMERTYKSNIDFGNTQLTRPVEDTRSTINIAFLSARTAAKNDVDMFEDIAAIGSNGNYALAVHFDIDHHKDYLGDGSYDKWEEYTWGGVFATFNAGIDNDRRDATYNYTIGVMLNAEKIDTYAEPRSLIADEDSETPKKYFGYFGLVVETGGRRKVADQRVHSTRDGENWNTWKLLTTNVVVSRDAVDKTVTISIRHLNALEHEIPDVDNGSTKTKTVSANMPYVIKLVPAAQLHGTLLIDSLYVLPGVNVTPHLVASVSQNANGYDFELSTEQKLNVYTILAYDRVGNLAVQNPELLRDNTKPTWSYTDSLEDWVDEPLNRVITSNERGSGVVEGIQAGKRFIAYYHIPPRNVPGKEINSLSVPEYRKAQLRRNELEDKGLLVSANGEVTRNSLPGGRLYSNAMEEFYDAAGKEIYDANGKPMLGSGYIAGFFQAVEDDGMPIRMYNYEIVEATSSTKDVTGEHIWEYNQVRDQGYGLPSNRDKVNSRRYPTEIDTSAAGISSAGSYKLRVQAENLFGVTSDWVETEPIWYDLDAPTISIEIEPSVGEYIQVATGDYAYVMAGNTYNTQDGPTRAIEDMYVPSENGGYILQPSGWYRDSINITVNAVDILRFGKGELGADVYTIGGVGVGQIHVVTNNHGYNPANHSYDSYVFQGENNNLDGYWGTANNTTLNKVITFNLTAEGANSFKVWAVDKFGRSTPWIEKNFDLNIDRKPPVLKVYQGGQTQTTEILDPEKNTLSTYWSSANVGIGFAVDYSDGLGVGTKELHWWVNNEKQTSIALSSIPAYGVTSSIPYYPRGTTESTTMVPREGVVGGFVPKDYSPNNDDRFPPLVLNDAERKQLRDAGILDSVMSDQYDHYEWQKDSVYTEAELIAKLNEIAFVDKQKIIDAWRYSTKQTGSGERGLHYHTIDSEAFSLLDDGYFMVSVNVVDKFGNVSNTGNFGYVLKDTGKPDIQVNLGGSFQSEWYVGGEPYDDYAKTGGGPLDELTGDHMYHEGILFRAQVGDMFNNNVLVTRSYYPNEKITIPDYYDNIKVRTPGSGVRKVQVWINKEEPLSIEIDEGNMNQWPSLASTRFGFSINKYYGESNIAADDFASKNFVIKNNGINMIKYMVEDFAGNAVWPYEDDVTKRQWNEVLGSWVYPSDKNVIRGIKVDTRPPRDVELKIITNNNREAEGTTWTFYNSAYTDTRPDEDNYPLYTKWQNVPVRFSGKDDGIGVWYAYFSASENALSVSCDQGVTNSMDTDDQYVKTDSWENIAKLSKGGNGFNEDPGFKYATKAVGGEQGILDYASYRIVQMGEIQGTRNLTLRMADFFGQNYTVPRSSIEEVSATFNYSDPDFATANYLSVSALSKGLYDAVSNNMGGYTVKFVENDVSGNEIHQFISGGFYDMPTKNREVKDTVNSGNMVDGLDKWGGYTIKTTTISAGVVDGKEIINELTVYLWDMEVDGREDHRTATVTADRQIVLDNKIYPSAIMPVTLPIKDLNYGSGQWQELQKDEAVANGLWTSQAELKVEYVHDEGDELSGITHIMFGGDIVSVRFLGTGNVTTTESYKPGEWVPYVYRSAGLTNNYIVTLRDLLIEGTRNVSIIGVRDRADNQLVSRDVHNVTVDMHSVEFYYDVGMPRDVTNRYLIKNQHGTVLNNKYYVGVPTYNLELDFNGAAYYDILEYSKETSYTSVRSNNYADISADTPGLPRVDGKPDFWVAINDIAMKENKGDGEKTLVIRLFDRGTKDMTEQNMLTITYNHWVDNTPPTLSITGLEDKDSKWYTPNKDFNLHVVDDGAGIASVVYQIRNDDTKTVDTVTRNYAFDSGERYPKATSLNYIKIARSGKNQIDLRVEDGVGNITIYNVDGIKVNTNPPVISEVSPLQGALSGNVIYTNQKALPLRVSGTGIDYLQFEVNTPVTYNKTAQVSRNANNGYAVTVTEQGVSGDGMYTLDILAYDKLYERYGTSGAFYATASYTVLLDRQPPAFSIETGSTGRITVVDDSKVISGRISLQGVSDLQSPVQVFYMINNTGSQAWPAHISGVSSDVWTIYIRDVIEQSGRSNGSYSLRIYAQDLAGNMSATSDVSSDPYKTAAFNVPDGYIMAPRGMVIRGLDIGASANLNEQQQAMQMASSKLGGVKYAPALDATALPVVQETPTAEPTANIVLTYSEAAAKQVDGKTDSFRIFYLDPVKNEWVIVPGQEAKETNGITAHDKEKRTLSAPVIGFGMYKIFDTTTFADNLKDVHMFPNPYKGNDGDLSNGEDGYANRDQIVLENITKTTRAKIYTISGELVTTLEDPNTSTHSLKWDLTNSRGAKVASGIYIILLTDEEGHRFIGRLTVVR